MSARRESDESALADRLVNYSDALVAVAFLGVSGLGVAIADPDIRCTIARAVSELMFANVLNAALYTGVIIVLRRWEMDLRSEETPSEKIVAYSRWLHRARLGIVWISFAFSIGLVAASRTPECPIEAEDVVATSATATAPAVVFSTTPVATAAQSLAKRHCG